MQPQLVIDVNEQTGIWTTDGLPMLYVPRHFFVNNHIAVEAALGRESYAEILYIAGYRSAYFWCQQAAKSYGLHGFAVFEHYLQRLSQRGWGLFFLERTNYTTGEARIVLRHSAFVLEQAHAKGKLCYMCSGWFGGAMDWVGHDTNRPYKSRSQELQCTSEGHDYCVFSVTAAKG